MPRQRRSRAHLGRPAIAPARTVDTKLVPRGGASSQFPGPRLSSIRRHIERFLYRPRYHERCARPGRRRCLTYVMPPEQSNTSRTFLAGLAHFICLRRRESTTPHFAQLITRFARHRPVSRRILTKHIVLQLRPKRHDADRRFKPYRRMSRGRRLRRRNTAYRAGDRRQVLCRQTPSPTSTKINFLRCLHAHAISAHGGSSRSGFISATHTLVRSGRRPIELATITAVAQRRARLLARGNAAATCLGRLFLPRDGLR